MERPDDGLPVPDPEPVPKRRHPNRNDEVVVLGGFREDGGADRATDRFACGGVLMPCARPSRGREITGQLAFDRRDVEREEAVEDSGGRSADGRRYGRMR